MFGRSDSALILHIPIAGWRYIDVLNVNASDAVLGLSLPCTITGCVSVGMTDRDRLDAGGRRRNRLLSLLVVYGRSNMYRLHCDGSYVVRSLNDTQRDAHSDRERERERAGRLRSSKLTLQCRTSPNEGVEVWNCDRETGRTITVRQQLSDRRL